ncbi:hypothetical protein Bca101_023720 [Brassica carinata]
MDAWRKSRASHSSPKSKPTSGALTGDPPETHQNRNSKNRTTKDDKLESACLNHGFFYLTNHGVPEELMKIVFKESKNLFTLPLDEKMVMVIPRSYSLLDLQKEFWVNSTLINGLLKIFCRYGGQPWNATIKVLCKDVGKKLLGLVALALDLEESFFERLGAFNDQAAAVSLLRYSGELNSSEEEEERCGASAHSDFGMLTLLATDGVPGLQVCRDKDKEPNVWEDVPGIKGAFVVNIGDLMERWTNGLFRSTMHRVLSVGKERYSVAVFLDPDPNCVVECLESCCNETSPPRFPSVRTSDYFHDRFSQTLILYSGSA